MSLQILCIHLKRFRHEMYFSSKINHLVSFPLIGLDMKPFLVRGTWHWCIRWMLQVACTVAQSIFSKLNNMCCNHNCRRVQNFNGLLILYIVLLNSAEPRLDRAHRCTTYDLVAVITHHGSVGGIVSVINEFVGFFVLFVCLFVCLTIRCKNANTRKTVQ